ncbi:acyl-CoA dehydrogenase family protein [Xylophilus sp. GOD-11R]|uniref:acyl-CoA dehydrogenase family protein n=1 Tax=Xylophilus sp. GOD-11R TaxID=3089814 RepID=UPI00298CF703|nr:acyl-CoA dehydrogenase family protein [Xylophilus sp. GOD-11R]WPB56641.1 acyl-CoA dehydrogenase family protein [Xylophilus sp. GOD-11R]
MSQDSKQGAAVALAHRIGSEISALHAADVDRNARFPAESIAALKEARLLSALVPVELGGMGMGMLELTAVCTALGQYCAASAMVFAMHQIQVACVVRHGLGSEYFRDYCRELVERQLLIGSITSEVGIGGDTRSSICAVEVHGDEFVLNKDATTVSYGAHADDLLVTCRRDPGAARSDQVMVLARKGQFTLEQTSQWDTLGMRGTCSPGFRFRSRGQAAQILPGDYADSSSQTMVPYSHILWSGLWLGIATDAMSRAAAFVRAAARRDPGTMPPTALRLAELSNTLQSMRSNVHDVARECQELQASDAGNESLLTIGFALKMNNLKISCSTLMVQVVHEALLICGIQGYKNDSKFSLGRHLRDAHSAQLMVGNDRIYARSASMLLVYKDT